MHRLRALAVISLFLTPALQAAVERPIHRTFNVAPGGTLTLDADIGSVHVRPGAGGVTVDVKRRAKNEDVMRDFDVTFEQNGNDVTVRAKYDHHLKWFNWGDELTAQFDVTVPANYNVRVTTSGSDIRVDDITGNADVRTSGGELAVGRIRGSLDGRTSGGDITVSGATGPIDVRTSGGSVEIGDAGSSVHARSSGGSIEVGHVAGGAYLHTSGGGISIDDAVGSVDAETSGGSIRARLSQQPHADSKLSTSGGGIDLSVAPNIAVDLDAHSSGGGVDSDVPITVMGTQREDGLQGKINGGGPRLVLRSSGGGIRLKRM